MNTAPPSLTVAPLAPGDLDRFADMVVGLYTDDPGPVEMTWARARAQAEAMLARPLHVWPMVARSEGAIVGYAVVVPFYSNEFGGEIAILDELYVSPEARDRGVGGAIVEQLKARAAERGAPRIELLVNHKNARVVPFYERHGFAVLSRWVLSQELAPGGGDQETR